MESCIIISSLKVYWQYSVGSDWPIQTSNISQINLIRNCMLMLQEYIIIAN